MSPTTRHIAFPSSKCWYFGIPTLKGRIGANIGIFDALNLKLRDYAISVTNNELESGNLIVDSKVKVDRVFSVSQRLVRMKIGRIKPEVHERITGMLFELLHAT